ncbi:hypothetical protein Y032_0098g3125 [Ancylostoma ceylanicum]|uniref:Uncharacterized protein n=1 Tax=Ancylostoma ceylanicum TaxID=53326 RepID=A0A016TJB6_9BILA|nr:hypothetical protein Y032_0098g3125 [Ancylostoma ceylanicum]
MFGVAPTVRFENDTVSCSTTTTDGEQEDYEMYKIHREGEKDKEKEKGKDKKNDKKRGKLSNIDEDDEKTKVTVIPIEESEETRRLERKKRSQEDMVADFVKILEQMMNPRQAVTSFVSAATGLAAVTVGTVYVYRLPETAVKAKKLVVILIIYGVLQVLLATAFFVTCMQTSIAVSKGVKDVHAALTGLHENPFRDGCMRLTHD